MRLVALFFVGAFLCNCIPHLIAGLQGSSFPTPFAKLRGASVSPPLLNFLWGFANLLTGLTLLARRPTDLGVNPDCLVMAAGALALGTFLTWRFGKVRAQSDVTPAP